ncbi:MAG: hypothetical protein GY787_28690 [Alteromonadales bacterium]|nr:hypothetical protein [Alteromonadales bacterium]
MIIDECHRVNQASTDLPDKVLKPLSKDKNSNEIVSNDKTSIDKTKDTVEDKTSTNQYQQIIKKLMQVNPEVKLLGLTATPYRLGMGWIYKKHYRGFMRSEEKRPFEHCIYELPEGVLKGVLLSILLAHFDQ